MRYFAVLTIGVLMWTASAAPAAAQGIADFQTTLDQVLVGEAGYQPVSDPVTALPAYVGFLIGWTAVVGIVMLVQLMLAAYEYMTAAGDSDKAASAKQRIRNVVLATLILAAGYIIATVVAYAWGSAVGYQTGINN